MDSNLETEAPASDEADTPAPKLFERPWAGTPRRRVRRRRLADRTLNEQREAIQYLTNEQDAAVISAAKLGQGFSGSVHQLGEQVFVTWSGCLAFPAEEVAECDANTETLYTIGEQSTLAMKAEFLKLAEKP